MTDAYNPATIGPTDLASLLARLDRYLNRHGSRYGEQPIMDDQRDDIRQGIIADWLGDDWTAREIECLAKHGKTLFPPDLSEIGRHLRAVLFHAGRCRRRGWRAAGAKQVCRLERDAEDFSGAGQSSRAKDPARLVAAVESATGELVLSPAAARNRSRRRLPLKYRGGVAFTPDDSPRPFRLMRRRGKIGYTLDVVERREDRTVIDIRSYRVYRFERVGSVPNRDVVRSRRPLPKGTGAAAAREALTGR